MARLIKAHITLKDGTQINNAQIGVLYNSYGDIVHHMHEKITIRNISGEIQGKEISNMAINPSFIGSVIRKEVD